MIKFQPLKRPTEFAPTLFVFMVTISFTLLILTLHQGDVMAFVRLGTRYGQGNPNGTIGYDGQFVYQIARQPLGAAAYLDIPAYRYQRILYPLAGRWLAFGQPALIPYMLIILNLIALTVGSYIMSLILAQHGLSRWYAVTVGLFAGQLVSLRLDLNEPFALTFALLAIYTFEKETARQLKNDGQFSYRLGAVYLSLSMLSKETSLLFVGGYLAYFFLTHKWWPLLETSLISLGPFAIWQAILWATLGEIGLRSGGQGATAFSLIPFGGLLGFGLQNLSTFITVLFLLGPLILFPCLALTINLIKQTKVTGSFSPITFILALHILMMATLPFSTYVDLPGVLRLTSGLVVSTVVYATITQQRFMLRYTTLWLVSGVLLIFVS